VLASGHVEMTTGESVSIDVFPHAQKVNELWTRQGCFVSVVVVDPATLALHWVTAPVSVVHDVVDGGNPATHDSQTHPALADASESEFILEAPGAAGAERPPAEPPAEHSADEVATSQVLSRERRQAEWVAIQHADLVAGESVVTVNVTYATQGTIGSTLVKLSFKRDSVQLGATNVYLTSPTGSFTASIPVSQAFAEGDTNLYVTDSFSQSCPAACPISILRHSHIGNTIVKPTLSSRELRTLHELCEVGWGCTTHIRLPHAVHQHHKTKRHDTHVMHARVC
jgi:hypothetical protein